MNAASVSMFAARHGDAGSERVLMQLDAGRVVPQGNETTGARPINASGAVTWGGYPLGVEAELSGGMVMSAMVRSLPQTLALVIERVRGRYIVEFPRPDALTPGARGVHVLVGSTHDFVRPAGLSVPTATTAERAKDAALEMDGGAAGGQAVTQPEAPSPEPVARTEASPEGSRVVVAPALAPKKPVAVDPLDITDEVQRAASPGR